MRPDEGKELDEYTQDELLDYADSIYERLHACRDKTIRKILRKKYIQLSHAYNAKEGYNMLPICV